MKKQKKNLAYYFLQQRNTHKQPKTYLSALTFAIPSTNGIFFHNLKTYNKKYSPKLWSAVMRTIEKVQYKPMKATYSQFAFTCSKPAIETPEQYMKYVICSKLTTKM